MRKIFIVLLLITINIASRAQITPTYGSLQNHDRKYFGLNGANVQDRQQGYQDPYIDGNLNTIKASHVRHIGGIYSMFHNWQTGYPLLSDQLLYGYNTPEKFIPNSGDLANTLEVFKNVIASEGAEMIYDLNVLTTKFNHQRAGIMNALSLGIKIKGIELGNELYNDGFEDRREFAFSFPTAEIYADSVNAYSVTLHNTFGSANTPKIAVIGADQKSESANNAGEETRVNTWLPRVLNKVNWLGATGPDAITIHRYPGSSYSADEAKKEMDASIADMNKFMYTSKKTLTS
jgi:hypothetical protein